MQVRSLPRLRPLVSAQADPGDGPNASGSTPLRLRLVTSLAFRSESTWRAWARQSSGTGSERVRNVTRLLVRLRHGRYRTNSHSDEAGALFLWACSIAFDHPVRAAWDERGADRLLQVEGRRVRVHEEPPNKFLSILSKEEKRWTRVKLRESQENVPPP